MTITPLNIVLLIIICMLAVGLYGLLLTRNLIKIVLVLQILVKPALRAWAKAWR